MGKFDTGSMRFQRFVRKIRMTAFGEKGRLAIIDSMVRDGKISEDYGRALENLHVLGTHRMMIAHKQTDTVLGVSAKVFRKTAKAIEKSPQLFCHRRSGDGDHIP